jgi:hypothetical protein
MFKKLVYTATAVFALFCVFITTTQDTVSQKQENHIKRISVEQGIPYQALKSVIDKEKDSWQLDKSLTKGVQ